MNFQHVLYPFLAAAIATFVLTILFRYFGKKGYLGNLYTGVRGGTPRALGIVPFVLLSLYFPTEFNDLILIIGVLAFMDDLLGRRKIGKLSIEWGQLFRGIGMLTVMVVGFFIDVGSGILGFSAILIALLVQPVNISDMQPGSTSMVMIIMSSFLVLAAFILGASPVMEIPAYYPPLIVLVVCLGYCPLDFSGKIMLGEIGNHSFAIALGICFYILGGFWATLILFIATTILIALIRKNSLKVFFARKLKLKDPTFGDFVMDVLTGGGLGDLLRRIFLRRRQIRVTNPLFITLGFRRLLFNPYALNSPRPNYSKYQTISALERK